MSSTAAEEKVAKEDEGNVSQSEEELEEGGAFLTSAEPTGEGGDRHLKAPCAAGNAFVRTAVSGKMDYAALGDSGRLVEQRQGKPQRRGLLAAHFAFKAAGTILYLLAGIAGLGYVSTFVFVVLLLSVDFWLVKNLSGRLLAGLRWWSVTGEQGCLGGAESASNRDQARKLHTTTKYY